jgi:hypothetical protein
MKCDLPYFPMQKLPRISPSKSSTTEQLNWLLDGHAPQTDAELAA